jgi:hypothetical protein
MFFAKIRQISHLLLQPYPVTATHKAQTKNAVLISLVVLFVLASFQPFGLDNLPKDKKWFVIAGYGLVCFVIVYCNYLIINFLFPKAFRESDWKVYKEICWSVGTTLLVGIGNYLYNNYVGILSANLGNALYMLGVTFLVSIVPLSVVVMLKYNYLLQKNLEQAMQLNQNLQQYQKQQIDNQHILPTQSQIPETVVLKGEDKNELFVVVSDLIYLEADDNYVDVWCFSKSKLQKITLRTTLKNIETTLQAYPQFVRCHRSYLVNLQQVLQVVGNSQGYKLAFEKTDFQVPVSRSLAKVLREKVENGFANSQIS